MKLKAALATSTAVLAIVTLAACSTGGSAPSSSSASSSVKMTLVTGTKGSPFYAAMYCGAQAAATELGVSVTLAAPDSWGAAAMLPVLDSVAAQKPSALLVVPTDVNALTDRLTSIKGGGAPIVELDQRVADASVSVSKIGSSDAEGGRLAAQALAKLIGGKGKVMAISSPPGTDTQYVRVDAFVAELKANFPGITYLGAQYALNDVTAAAGFVTSTLASNPDLAGVFVANDINAIGAVTGLDEAKVVGKVKVVAYDAASTEVDALKRGAVQALIAQDPYGEGHEGVVQALAALKGTPNKAEIAIPFVTLTAADTAGLDAYMVRNGGC